MITVFNSYFWANILFLIYAILSMIYLLSFRSIGHQGQCIHQFGLLSCIPYPKRKYQKGNIVLYRWNKLKRFHNRPKTIIFKLNLPTGLLVWCVSEKIPYLQLDFCDRQKFVSLISLSYPHESHFQKCFGIIKFEVIYTKFLQLLDINKTITGLCWVGQNTHNWSNLVLNNYNVFYFVILIPTFYWPKILWI